MQVIQPQKSGGQLFQEAFNPYLQMIMANMLKKRAEEAQTKKAQEALTPATSDIQRQAKEQYGKPFQQMPGLPPEIANQRVKQKYDLAQQNMGMQPAIPQKLLNIMNMGKQFPGATMGQGLTGIPGFSYKSPETDWSSEFYKKQVLGGNGDEEKSVKKDSRETFLKENPQFTKEDLDVVPVYSTNKGLKIKTGEDVKVNEKRYENRIANEKQRDFIIASAEDTLNSITKVKDQMDEFGFFGPIPKIPGTKAYVWQSHIDKLLSSKIVELITTMKSASKTGATGFGQLSEKEGQILREASTALKKGLPKSEAMEILNKMETLLKKVVSGGQSQLPEGFNSDEWEVVPNGQ